MLLFYYEACEGGREFYHKVGDQWWELPSETPAGEFYSLHHGVDGYAREEEIVVLIMGEDVDVFVSSNMESWMNKTSRLSDTVLCFLVALM